MKTKLAALLFAATTAGAALAAAQTPVQAPQPAVPEIFTRGGGVGRVADGNDGYARAAGAGVDTAPGGHHAAQARQGLQAQA